MLSSFGAGLRHWFSSIKLIEALPLLIFSTPLLLMPCHYFHYFFLQWPPGISTPIFDAEISSADAVISSLLASFCRFSAAFWEPFFAVTTFSATAIRFAITIFSYRYFSLHYFTTLRYWFRVTDTSASPRHLFSPITLSRFHWYVFIIFMPLPIIAIIAMPLKTPRCCRHASLFSLTPFHYAITPFHTPIAASSLRHAGSSPTFSPSLRFGCFSFIRLHPLITDSSSDFHIAFSALFCRFRHCFAFFTPLFFFFTAEGTATSFSSSSGFRLRWCCMLLWFFSRLHDVMPRFHYFHFRLAMAESRQFHFTLHGFFFDFALFSYFQLPSLRHWCRFAAVFIRLRFHVSIPVWIVFVTVISLIRGFRRYFLASRYGTVSLFS